MDFLSLNVVVNIESRKGAKLLFAYLNGADQTSIYIFKHKQSPIALIN